MNQADLDFVNEYIQRLMEEVGELKKLQLAAETKARFLEKVNAELVKKFEEQNVPKAEPTDGEVVHHLKKRVKKGAEEVLGE